LNKKCLTSLLVLFVLIASSATALSAADDEVVKIVIDAAHETRHDGDLEDLPTKLESWGYTVEVVTDEITADVLEGAMILLIPIPQGLDYTASERNAVADWFNAGEVAVWIAADSDYDGPELIPRCNAILTKLGSSIMFENASVEEPDEEFNDGAAYRVVASTWNADHPIAAGVSKETFHGPTFIYGLKDGSPVDLNTTSIDNVEWVAKSSDGSVIVSPHLSPIMTPEMVEGDNGPFVMMATEEKAGDDASSKIVLTTEAIFTSYKFMNADGPSEKGNHDIQGETLLKNTIEWMEEVSKSSSNTMLYAGIGIVIIIIIAAAAMMTRKK